ncbi:transposase [Rathayibacter rathayi]|nr:transposase [Rathayibacter rathayi]PPG75596.1 transposase [Rathayibacter rathayi]PPG87622.1 transposase [Rathayibacter rathayi]PPH22423.1 transposase [Rathayibacter rathayi]PPI75507.1 transposase [Rathayibacter rathayi]
MRYDSTTGLSSGQVTELVARIFQILSGRSSLPGRPAVLNLRKHVIVTLLLLRQNLDQAAVADLHGVSQATVSRIYRRIVPLIEQACCFSGISLEEAVRGRIVLVDGTDVPTRNRAEAGRSNSSGKRHRQGLNVQIAADLDGRLLAASDPIAGARHDRAALALCGWEPILDRTNWIADPGYIGTTTTTPRTRSRDSTLDDNTKKTNREISRSRSLGPICSRRGRVVPRERLGSLRPNTALVTSENDLPDAVDRCSRAIDCSVSL